MNNKIMCDLLCCQFDWCRRVNSELCIKDDDDGGYGGGGATLDLAKANIGCCWTIIRSAGS